MYKAAVYDYQVTDPWFSINRKTNDSVGVLGCLDRRLICNGEDNCAVLSTNITDMSLELQLSRGQAAILDRLSTNIDAARFMVSNIYQGDLFLANQLSLLGSIAALPDNQWQKELENWFQVGLTLLQLQTAQYVASTDGILNDTERIPPSDENRWMCKSQMIVRDDYTSFSLLGIVIIILIGGSIILLNLFISPIFAALNARFFRTTSDTLEWETDGLLQLQRLAYENGGIGHWTTGKHEVPLSHSRSRFGLPLHKESSQLKNVDMNDTTATSTRSLTHSIELSRVSLLDVTKGGSRVVGAEDDDSAWRAV